MNVDYVIVQAGGKGSRMARLTRNKPKALVPVDNLPMLFHLFKKYPEKHYIIIGDYLHEVLEKYLHAFAEVDYQCVCASGHAGTCAGLRDALQMIPEGNAFMLIWCDLILPEEYHMPEETKNYVGISKDFPCRWKYENGVFEEERSTEFGVAGHFIFTGKDQLQAVPEEGEFVRWLRDQDISFAALPLWKTHEYGLISEWEKLPKTRCRPFNRIEIQGDRLIKRPITAQGEALAKREIAWYQKLEGLDFENLPKIYSYSPLTMELIDGSNIYEYEDLPIEKKRDMLLQIVSCLKSIHKLETIPADPASYENAYLGKTWDRLAKVRDLVPFANAPTVTVNGRVCRNIFFCQDEVSRRVMEYMPEQFCFIHGDCTFSNMMMKRDKTPVLIDPRGYFGHTELDGDVAYDWVKLYYSLISNYDQFNLKRFDLEILPDGVTLNIASNHWEELEDDFFELVGDEVSREQMKLLLAIIWLSLTTYAWEDYDSICGAFYNGLYYLEEALS